MTRLKQYTIWRDPEDHLHRIHKNAEEHHYIELLVLVKVRDSLDAGSFKKSCPVIGLMCSPYNREHCIQTSSHLSERIIIWVKTFTIFDKIPVHLWKGCCWDIQCIHGQSLSCQKCGRTNEHQHTRISALALSTQLVCTYILSSRLHGKKKNVLKQNNVYSSSFVYYVCQNKTLRRLCRWPQYLVANNWIVGI